MPEGDVVSAASARRAPAAPRKSRPAQPLQFPADFYPLPGDRTARLGPGLRTMRDELRAMDGPALDWDLRRVRRALAAFTSAERRSEYGTPEFNGSRRNPIVFWTAAYPYLFSDYLQEREWSILREIRRRGGESDA